MIELIIVILLLLFISFSCSILESVILSMTDAYVQTLIDKKHSSGKLLDALKKKIDEPIAAILTLNTISHTVGAALSGAIAMQVFGSRWMALFSALLTFVILVFSEIIPKTLGAHYWKSLGPVSAFILKIMIVVLGPIIRPLIFLTNRLSRGHSSAMISKEEVYSFIQIGYRQGLFVVPELEISENLFKLRDLRVKNIMTPRTIVTWLPPETTIREMKGKIHQLTFSRMPLYNASKNEIAGIVLRRNIADRILSGKWKDTLKSISSPPVFVPETFSVLKLLNKMIKEKIHMAVVINEYGDYAGVVTLEDAIESLLGKEIVDEFDRNVDMRKAARDQSRRRSRKTMT